MYTELRDYIGPRGGNWAFLVRNQKAIGEFIQQQKIAPLNVDVIPAERARRPDGGINGGIRVAHLHFDKGIYVLSDEQWATFSGNIATRLKSKLARTKVIPFEAAMEVGSSMDLRMG